MSALASQLVPTLGWALIDFLWQGLLLGLVVLPLMGLLRGARPQTRYALLLLALAACVLLPLLSLWRGLSLASAPLPELAASNFIAPQFFDDSGVSAGTIWQSRWQHYLPFVVASWALGASLLALRFMLGLSWVARTRGSGLPPGFDWQSRLERLSAAVGLPGPPRLLLVQGLDSPAVAGWWRPVVMLPAALVARMPSDLLEALLAHELAHVRRHDYLVNLVQGAVEALLFYHPVVWWISRRLRVERELIADDLAIHAIGQARPLALALQHLERMQAGLDHPFPSPQFAPAAHGGHLMNRIKRLLRPTPAGPHWKSGLPLIGVTALCLAVYAQASSQVPAAPARAPVAAASPVAPAAPATPTTPTTPAAVAPLAAIDPVDPMDSLAPVAPVAPIAPEAPWSEPDADASDHDMDGIYFNGERDHDPYALVRQGREGLMISGDLQDAAEVRKTRQQLKGDFLWFRHDGKAYIVTDPQVLASAQRAWAPAEALGEKMSALGEQMRPHSERMEALGKQMEVLSERGQPEREQMEAISRSMQPLAEKQRVLAERMQALSARMMRADRDADRERLSQEMEQLSAQMEPLNRQMSEVGTRLSQHGQRMQQAQQPMQALGEQMRQASAPMQALGDKMQVLGKQQEKLSHQADAELKRLIERALREGKAQPSSKLSDF